MVRQDLKYFKDRFNASPKKSEFEWLKENMQADPKHFKYEPRIYPGYWAPVLISEQNENFVVPLRYRVRPAGSQEEMPSRYNVFNARIDSLYSRTTWKNLIGRRHGLLVAEKFYEWVEDSKTGKKKVVAFHPTIEQEIFIPVLWDYWTDGRDHIASFALITDEPPQEVIDAGHDRCPIDLSDQGIDSWVRLKGKPLENLQLRRRETFGVEDVLN